jgi:hypothetical protein
LLAIRNAINAVSMVSSRLFFHIACIQRLIWSSLCPSSLLCLHSSRFP